MTRIHLIDGKKVPYTSEEEAQADAEEKAWADGAFDRERFNLRRARNSLLAASDWVGLSDTALINEQAAEWKMYRQKLRDLPSGLDTVEKVNAVTWPEKPE
jgi:hypothetical protein